MLVSIPAAVVGVDNYGIPFFLPVSFLSLLFQFLAVEDTLGMPASPPFCCCTALTLVSTSRLFHLSAGQGRWPGAEGGMREPEKITLETRNFVSSFGPFLWTDLTASSSSAFSLSCNFIPPTLYLAQAGKIISAALHFISLDKGLGRKRKPPTVVCISSLG